MTGLDDVVMSIVKMATLVNKDDLPQSSKKGHDTRVTVARGGKYTL